MTHLTTAEAYLKRPYQRVLIPDPEKGGYTAKIAEFPGCVTEGDTAAKALKRLEDVAESWIEAVLDMGQAVPEPMAEQEYSGKLMLRLSRSLHRRAAEMAHAEGVSLNQFIVITLAERAGTIQAKATAKTTMVLASREWARPSIPLGKPFLTGTEDLRLMVNVQPPTTPDQAVR
jgi:predicted RNase H-like HicB family nuclease